MYEDLKKENEELKKFKENTEEMCGAYAVTEDLMKKIETQDKVMKRQTKEIEQLKYIVDETKYNFDTIKETLDYVNDKYDKTKTDIYETDCDCGCDDLRIRISRDLIINVMATNGIFVNEDEINDFTEVVAENTTMGFGEYVDMNKLKENIKEHIIGINSIWEGEDSDSEEEA